MSGLLDALGQTVGGVVGSPLVGVGLRMVLLYLAVVWLACAWWVWRDARSRSRDVLVPYVAAAGIVLATPILFPLAAVVYRIVRPSVTVAAAESSQLQLAVLAEDATRPACGTCGSTVDDEWVACPICGAELAVRCPSCGRPLELDWSICAWCAADVPWAAPAARLEDERPVPGPVAIPIRPGGQPLVPVMAAGDDREPVAEGVPARSPRRRRRRAES